MRAFAVAVSGVIGLPIGSFLSVVVHRVPDGESIVRPRSHCPNCGVQLEGRDTIPVVSYALSRGRCRHCKEPISPRYVVLEVTTAVLFGAVAASVASLWAAPAFCVLVAALLALSIIDVERMRLPTPIISATALIGLPLLVLGSLGTHAWHPLVSAVIAGAVTFVVFALVFLVAQGGMGFGDVRLAALCGVFLGWLGPRIALVGFLCAFVLGGLGAFAVLAARRGGAKTRIPFGPFIAAGSVLAVLFGSDIVRVWLG